MKAPTIMPVHVLDTADDITTMSTLGTGGYFRIHLSMWWHGGRIVGDEDLLRRITRMDRRQWKSEREAILEHLIQREDDEGRTVWTHERLRRDFDRARLRSLQNAKNARGKRL